MQPKHHCKKSSSSHSESNCDSVSVITKYFWSAESQAVANANSSESSSDNSDVIVIESDDELTETEDTISAKSTHYSPTTVASTRNTIVNNMASSSVGCSDSGMNPSMSELLQSDIGSKTVTNSKSSLEINDIGLIIQGGM